MKDLTIASVQFNHAPGDKERNLTTIASFVASAKAQGVDLLVFPEMCITGYWHVRKLSREAVDTLAEPVPDGPSCQALLRHARETGIIIGAGLIERGADRQLYNSYFVAQPDGQFACHRKLHCFISEHMASGDAFTVFETPFGKMGVLICYDNNIGENVRMTALQGAEILLAPHQTGGCDTPSPRCMGAIDPALWENRANDPEAIAKELHGPKGREWLVKWLPARAHDNGLFIVYSNGIGVDDDEVRTGNAMILDCYGDIVAESTSADDDLVIAELKAADLDMCTGRRWITSRRPELYGPLAEQTGMEEDTRVVRFKRK